MTDYSNASSNNPLSRDIRLLGNLLGHIIQEQHGQSAFELVETVRKTAIARRNRIPGAAEQLIEHIQNTPLADKQVLVKAFSNYFQLINIAEDQQRIRVLREREAGGNLSESILSAIKRLHEQGMTAEEMVKLLESLRLRLVLTAHPSEAKRKEVLIKLRTIAQFMEKIERERLLPREHALVEQDLAAEIEELWQTRPIRANKTTVADEVDFGLYFVTAVIMDVAVDIVDDLRAALKTHYPDHNWDALPSFLHYASWIGGDRDGNPNVTTEATMQTLATLRTVARETYMHEIGWLRQHLTQTKNPALDPVLDAKLDNERYPGEPYRAAMDAIHQKLADDNYPTGADLLNDLTAVYQSLLDNQSNRVANTVLRKLIMKIRIFGLHLTPLEVREDAGLHAAALDELFRNFGIHTNYLEADEATKQTILTREIINPRPLFPIRIGHLSSATQRIIETWQMIAQAHAQYGSVVIDTVIASMSKQPSDVLAMLLFADEVGIASAVKIVPLFETIEDLRNAPDVMRQLFKNPAYRAYMDERAGGGNLHQQIMIGYSDSSKDGGYLASNWNLYTAQQTLTEACAKEKVSLELFHGRGGSIGRGGGPTNRAIRSQPPQSLRGGIKITEQGEVIAYRYSNTDIAHRHLQQVVNASLLALGIATEEETRPEWIEAMRALSEYGRVAYRDFVYESDGFLPYWQSATPINELSQLRISSRPAKRKSKGGFAAMRAIPWVFSWMQSRAIIPSWFGIGTAFDRYCNETENGQATLQAMYAEWSFFRAVVDNAQLDVAKADMGIAELYASLVQDQAIRDEMFGRIQTEHDLTYRMICKVTQQPQLLENMKAIRTSIERRNPYVDPLNFIQVDLLRQLRDIDPESDEHQQNLDVVLATINGIAAGMKTTG